MRRTEPALKLIIGYKLARAAGVLAASGLLVALTVTGHAVALDELAERLRHHVTGAWSIALADVLVRAVVPRHLWMLAAALALDGTHSRPSKAARSGAAGGGVRGSSS